MTIDWEFRAASLSSPPSRDANPFSTCWTRPGAIPFQFSDDQNVATLIARLAAMRWRGAIVGPHGSGKSTLLETLKPALSAAGRHVRAVALQDRQRRLPKRFLEDLPERRGIAIIDGYEQLGWLHQLMVSRFCRRTGMGLLVTTHSQSRIPTLIRLQPDAQLVHKLVEGLAAKLATRITPTDVAASHACHGANVREIFFDLYDLHERVRRAERTPTAGRA